MVNVRGTLWCPLYFYSILFYSILFYSILFYRHGRWMGYVAYYCSVRAVEHSTHNSVIMGDRILRNVSTLLPDYSASHPRRWKFSVRCWNFSCSLRKLRQFLVVYICITIYCYTQNHRNIVHPQR
jgi:hypothetical protein